MTDQPVLLLVGSGSRLYREYLLASAAERVPIWLLDSAAPTWQAPYIVGWSQVDLVDRARLVPDQRQLVEAARAVAAMHRVVGAFSYDETLVVTTAAITDLLGLRGLTSAGVDNCRNKHRTRQVLTAAGLVQPRYAVVQDAATARAAARSFGYPVILKPRGMGASIGVVRAGADDETEAGFLIAEAASHAGSPSYEGGVLVEEFLHGPEISVDGVVVGGAYEPMFVARKRVGPEPFMEEIGHVVDAADPLLHDADIRRVLSTAHRALGVRDGITHTEVKLTPRGPAIVEVNARLGGDLIPYLGKLATGIDPAHVAVDVATGTSVRLEPSASRVVGIRFGYPHASGRVRSVHVPAEGEVPGLLDARAMVQPGTELLLPPDGYLARYAYVICAAEDVAGCEEALDRAAARTSVQVDALVEDTRG
jgi:biotin carboxylase